VPKGKSPWDDKRNNPFRKKLNFQKRKSFVSAVEVALKKRPGKFSHRLRLGNKEEKMSSGEVKISYLNLAGTADGGSD